MEIRRSYDRLISTMGFPILVRWHLCIESGPSIPILWPPGEPYWKAEDATTLQIAFSCNCCRKFMTMRYQNWFCKITWIPNNELHNSINWIKDVPISNRITSSSFVLFCWYWLPDTCWFLTLSTLNYMVKIHQQETKTQQNANYT